MKAKLLTATAVLVLAAGFLGAGCAHQRDAVQTTGQQDQNASYLTGSYLPQDVTRNGPVTNGKNDVRVIDRNDIDRSGGSDVRQTLRELGATH